LCLTGAELVIDGGLSNGLLVGRNLVVRRHYQVRGTVSADVVAEHTAGLVQIVSASGGSAVAVVVYACDDLRKNDFLASFKPEPIREPEPPGAPAFYDAARILFADEGQTLGSPQRQMVIDRGSVHGVRAGQRFTLFRQPGGRGAGAIKRRPAGDAVVVAVRSDSATFASTMSPTRSPRVTGPRRSRSRRLHADNTQPAAAPFAQPGIALSVLSVSPGLTGARILSAAGYRHVEDAAVVAEVVVVDAEHQAARGRHRQRLRLHADSERRTVADLAG
jgi:hypothetical protein